MGIQKLTLKEKATKSINFTCPYFDKYDESLKLYILSDSYFGLDQEIPISIYGRNKHLVNKYYKNLDLDEILKSNKQMELEKLKIFEKEEDNNTSHSDISVTEFLAENDSDLSEVVYDNW